MIAGLIACCETAGNQTTAKRMGSWAGVARSNFGKTLWFSQGCATSLVTPRFCRYFEAELCLSEEPDQQGAAFWQRMPQRRRSKLIAE
jgi:hypothetical protein